jgi:GT2 family glycosyltransferase
MAGVMNQREQDYPSASVVIPTYNRLADLQRVVAAVQRQFVPEGFRLELIVVDDGSSDGTWAWLERQVSGGGLVALRQDNAGPARARNRGAAEAGGSLVMFLGDDTVPEDGWLLAHLEEHRLFGGSSALAVVGYTSFPQQLDSPFLRFINEYGAQFGYLLIERPVDVPFNFFYTSNVSLSRELMVQLGGFREDFPAAAWEDIEFAYRAVASGLRLRYQPLARTIHNHRIHPRTFCRRQRTSGRSAAIFLQHHAELAEFLGVDRLEGMPRAVRWRAGALRLLIEAGERIPGLVPHRVCQEYLDLHYLRGLAEGLHRG